MGKRDCIDISLLPQENFSTIIDVRSPSEFAEDHIPSAINCPVLSDAERVEIGTLYKQISPFVAKKKGAALIARNIAHHIEELFSQHDKSWRPLIYCWRGGQRSRSMQTILQEIGWNAALLQGGYKAYRTHVMHELSTLPQRFKYVVIAGPTGSGKTLLLKMLEEQGAQTLDLEGLAEHKGSILGFDPAHSQPSQKMFDTMLLSKLSGFDVSRPLFVEAESRKIGNIQQPEKLYESIRCCDFISLDVPLDERIAYLIKEYEWFCDNPDILKDRLSILKEIRGKKSIAQWLAYIDAGDWPPLIRELLETHYDPLYTRSSKREGEDEYSRQFFKVSSIDETHFKKLTKMLMETYY